MTKRSQVPRGNGTSTQEVACRSRRVWILCLQSSTSESAFRGHLRTASITLSICSGAGRSTRICNTSFSSTLKIPGAFF